MKITKQPLKGNISFVVLLVVVGLILTIGGVLVYTILQQSDKGDASFLSSLLSPLSNAGKQRISIDSTGTLLVEEKDVTAHFIGLPTLYGRVSEGQNKYWWVSNGAVFSFDKEKNTYSAFGKIGDKIIDSAFDVIEWGRYVWIALQGEGIIRYDQKNGSSRFYSRENEEIFAYDQPFTKRNGLISNSYIYFVSDNFRNELWVTTLKGPSLYSKTTDSWISYGDGKTGIKTQDALVLQDRILFIADTFSGDTVSGSGVFSFNAKNQQLEAMQHYQDLLIKEDANKHSNKRYLNESVLADLLKNTFSGRQPSSSHISNVGKNDMAYISDGDAEYFFDLSTKTFSQNQKLGASIKALKDTLNQEETRERFVHYFLPFRCKILSDWQKNDAILFEHIIEGNESEEASAASGVGVYSFSLKDGTPRLILDFKNITLGPKAKQLKLNLDVESILYQQPIYCDNQKFIVGNVVDGLVVIDLKSGIAEINAIPQLLGRFDAVAGPDKVFVASTQNINQLTLGYLDSNTLQMTSLSVAPIPNNIASGVEELHLQSTDGNIFVFTETLGPRGSSNPFSSVHRNPFTPYNPAVPLLIYSASTQQWSRHDLFNQIGDITVWQGKIIAKATCITGWCRGDKIVPKLVRLFTNSPVPIYTIESPFITEPVYRSMNALWITPWIYLDLP